MTKSAFPRRLLPALVALLAVSVFSPPESLEAQDQEAETAIAAPAIDEAQLETFVRVHLAMNEVRDQLHEDLAAWHDNTRRQEVREDADQRIEAILEEHGVTAREFEEFTQLVSIDQTWRDAFEETMDRVESGG